jgi:hypothetical protein
MTIPLSGQVFEATVLRAMRFIPGCEVFASEELDNERKVDVEIRMVQGKRLEMPVQVQITTRIDHFTKLRNYLKTRRRYDAVVNLYVEVEPDATFQAEKIALELTQSALAVQTRPWGRRWPIFGLRIGQQESSYFDPFVKYRALRKDRDSPERKQALRKGVAHDFLQDRFTISGEDGGTYDAHFIDVDEASFRSQLRESVGKGDALFMVWFLPSKNFAHDVRPREESSKENSS